MTGPKLRRACGCIDVHTHVVPEKFPAYAGRNANVPWPSMAPAQPCHQHVMMSGEIYRTVSNQSWDTGVRLADMDEQGLTRHVLSPMPELLSYWLDADDGRAMCRFLNESIATMVAAAPSRFVGLGAVPLQDVDAAIAELEHLVKQVGLAGVEIGTNANGVPIGAPALRPFFEAAESLGAAVFVHALRPAGMDRLVGPAQLQQVVAFPGEVGLAAASMITGGTLAACPNLRIAFSHGGGTLQAILPRLQHVWSITPAMRDKIALEPRQAVRTMFYDDLVYDAATVDRLLSVFGETQLMCGSDYPFTIRDQDPAGTIDRLAVDDRIKELMMVKNAERWLGEAPAGAL